MNEYLVQKEVIFMKQVSLKLTNDYSKQLRKQKGTLSLEVSFLS